MNREAIQVALFNLLSTVSGVVTITRRTKLWADFNPPQKPCICISMRDNDYKRESEACPSVITMEADIFIYTTNSDADGVVPATQMNALLDAIDVAMRPDNMVMGLLTLGGLVSHCWIEGRNIVENGDLDGDGIAVISIKMIVPGNL